MTSEQWEEIQRVHASATPGPWHWGSDLKHKSIMLLAYRGMGNLIMDFVRWGMSGAQPRFRDGGIMKKSSEMTKVIPGREHHASWAQQLDHPDALLIEKCWEHIGLLIAEVKRLRGEQ